VRFARDAAKAVLEDREEKMLAMRMELGRLRVEIRESRERKLSLQGEVMALEGERESAVVMLEAEERRMGGEGVFQFRLGVVVDEESHEYKNVEVGDGHEEGIGDETGGYLSCEE
jgi:hypothetical protein